MYGSVDTPVVPEPKRHNNQQEELLNEHYHNPVNVTITTTTDPARVNNDNNCGAGRSDRLLYSSSAEESDDEGTVWYFWEGKVRIPVRPLAMSLSLYVNVAIVLLKLWTFLRSYSLSVLAALLDSILDVVSQIILYYTERNSRILQQRSSAMYPAGASRLEPIGVLTCAALMGMVSFEVIKESFVQFLTHDANAPYNNNDDKHMLISFINMLSIVAVKLILYALCQMGATRKRSYHSNSSNIHNNNNNNAGGTILTAKTPSVLSGSSSHAGTNSEPRLLVVDDPTLEALALDHWNDILSNLVAAVALLCLWRSSSLWFLDPIGAIVISIYIIYSWYLTGKEQIEQLTGRSAPSDFVTEIRESITNMQDERIIEIDTIRAYHFGPKFLVEVEVVLPKDTLLSESHDIGMELQYEIESRDEVERCFVHLDYETRPYDEHVVSKVPELRAKYQPRTLRSMHSL